jgi:hypothetical protein
LQYAALQRKYVTVVQQPKPCGYNAVKYVSVSNDFSRLLGSHVITNIHATEGTMNTKDTKNTSVAGSARPMIAPKNVVRVTTEADRRTVITAARAVITEHRDVIKALAKR